jgi:thymidylate kinase
VDSDLKTILVTLSGTHGTGKSTNAGRCYYLLNRAGLRFSYLRHQDILDPFGFIMRRTARILGYKNPNDLQKTRPMTILWSVYLLLIYIPILVGGIKLRRLLGNSVVCDRYLYDLLVGFWGDEVKIPIEHLLVWILPHPDVSFVLDAELSRILEDRPEHTSRYIRLEKQLYDSVAEQFGLMRISTNDPPLKVWNTMFATILSALGVNLPSN